MTNNYGPQNSNNFDAQNPQGSVPGNNGYQGNPGSAYSDDLEQDYQTVFSPEYEDAGYENSAYTFDGPSQDQDAEDSSGRQLPLRLLAIILAIIGGLMIVWGVVSIIRGDDDVVVDDSPSTTSTSGSTSSNEPAPAIDRATYPITVLNSTPITGLASNVEADLRSQTWGTINTGNVVGGDFPQTVVLYNPDDPAAQEAAKQIAQEMGVQSAEITPEQQGAVNSSSAEGPIGAVVVVLAGDDPAPAPAQPAAPAPEAEPAPEPEASEPAPEVEQPGEIDE